MNPFCLKTMPQILEYMELTRMPGSKREKEFSESWAVFETARSVLDSKTPAWCFTPGDGTRSLTAYVAALNSGWHCTSIDPISKHCPKHARVTAIKSKLEDLQLTTSKHAVILLVHSHVTLEQCISHIIAPSYTIVACPCCIPQDSFNGIFPDKTFSHEGILSEKKEIKIWNSISF